MLQDGWKQALDTFSSKHLYAGIVPSVDNSQQPDFSERLRLGAVALGLWGGWPALPQVGQYVTIASGGSGYVVDLASSGVIVAASDSTTATYKLNELSVKNKVRAPTQSTVAVLLEVLQWHMSTCFDKKVQEGEGGFVCGWLALQQRSMVMRAVAQLTKANPTDAIQLLVSSNLLRPVIQMALQAEVEGDLPTMLNKQEARSQLVLCEIVNVPTAACTAPPMGDNQMNPLFAFRKVQLAAMANKDKSRDADAAPAEDDGVEGTIVYETRASLQEKADDGEADKKVKPAAKIPKSGPKLALEACSVLKRVTRLQALSAAVALCPVLAQSDAYRSLVSSEGEASRQADADLVFQLLNACYLVGGSMEQTEKCLEAMMANCDTMVPCLLRNAEQDVQASTQVVKRIPTIKQTVWATSECRDLEQVQLPAAAYVC